VGTVFGVALDPEVSRAYPECQVRFVVARGLTNRTLWTDTDSWLTLVEASVAAGTWRPFGEQDAAIASWHAAYRDFGVNPRRVRPSVDALGRRLTRQGKLPRINSAVDTYNLISVAFGVPAGAFDIDRVDGPIDIRFARPNDEFTPLGEPDATEQPLTGEVVYATGDRVLTRCWNHRDADQTKVTPDSENVLFVVERVTQAGTPTSQLAQAQRTLADFLQPHATEVITCVIEPETPQTLLHPDEPALFI
jgi:DNA/RNA-binding domain of Phe-tRNA-synthetase-like protein